MKIKPYDYGPIGIRIKQIRKSKHLTQEQLSEMIDMTQKNLSQLERGLCGLSISSLISICDVLETSADYILFGESKNSNNPILDMLSELSQKEQLYACEILETYIKSCKNK